MSDLQANLIRLYIPLIAWVGLGIVLGFKLPKVIPLYLGKFLFWVGVPISIMTFLRQADLSESIWVVPAIAWIAIFSGAGLGWMWISAVHTDHLGSDRPQQSWSLPTRGSFLLSAMVGNTGYLGYPVALSLMGPQYFAWAIFYDTLGSTLGAYGLGVALAARFGIGSRDTRQLMQAILINPALWSFWIGLLFRQVSLPDPIEQGLQGVAWTIIASSLLLLGMRLSQVSSWRNAQRAAVSLSIKMLIVPLVLGLSLPIFGLTGPARLVVVLQMAMPPAFATLVIAEAYHLDRELTVTALAMGSVGILATLPIWLWLFGE